MAETTPTPHPATTPPHARGRARTAAFFDLDKTIIATSSAAAFSAPFYRGGLISRTAALRSAYAHFLFMMGGASESQTERLRANLSTLVTGWPVEQVTAIVADTLHQYIDPVVYAEALDLIDAHRSAGRDVIIVSASGSELVAPIASLLGADDYIATHMQIVDGHYTGLIDFYAYGPHKATAIEELAQVCGYDLTASYAYSDSITDAPMLTTVGHAYTVNPDRALRKLAQENHWGILTFRRPVALRRRGRRSALLGGMLLAAGITALFLAMRARRRARQSRSALQEFHPRQIM